PDCRIVYINPAAERALHLRKDDVVGLSHWTVFPASIGVPERYYRRVQSERVEAHFTHHYQGEGLDFHAELDVYPTEDGGIAVFWRDVSEQVRTDVERERLLWEAEAACTEAEAANRAECEFVASVSH